MDKIGRTTDLVIALNRYKKSLLTVDVLINKVCAYFDYIKDLELTHADKIFLFKIANQIGIPHYFDILKNFKNSDNLAIEHMSLESFSSFLYESTLYVDDNANLKLHKYQKEVLDLFQLDNENRFFLSASTSFGKTFLVYEVIKKMKYKNIILVFPTIALLSENLEKIQEHEDYTYFQDNYKIHTLSNLDTEDYFDKNIFLYTPERFLSYLDQNEAHLNFDFIFIDEVYKMDNEYIIDEDTRENERDLAYRMAIHYAFKNYSNIDALLAGPYISFYNVNLQIYNSSFDNFLKDCRINLIDKNSIEIVNKKTISIKSAKTVSEETLGTVSFLSNEGINLIHKDDRLNILLGHLYDMSATQENCIIYNSTKSYVEKTAKDIIKSNVFNNYNHDNYQILIEHIEKNYHKDWIVLKALKQGIGIHHGSIPKYIQKDIINLFNKKDGGLFVLIATTTITEGVNTSAKNLIVLNARKGSKPLKKFDAKNIIGRAGRFYQHYTGRVIILKNNEFEKILNSQDEYIKHKNYDKDVEKNDLDIEITKEEYLTDLNKQRRLEIFEKQRMRNIPEDVIRQFKVISREDKIIIYDLIKELTSNEHILLEQLIEKINYKKPTIDYEGFQKLVEIIKPIVTNKNLLFLLEKSEWNEQNPSQYSRITNKLFFYLKDGFKGAFDFNKDVMQMDVDKAMRKTSDFIFNTLKYQLVKYFGVFNLMYKVERSQTLSKTFEEIHGIDRLLIKLEYNAFSKEARIANDYGVPNNIIRYYDMDESERSNVKFDNYEQMVFRKIDKLIHDM